MQESKRVAANLLSCFLSSTCSLTGQVGMNGSHQTNQRRSTAHSPYKPSSIMERFGEEVDQTQQHTTHKSKLTSALGRASNSTTRLLARCYKSNQKNFFLVPTRVNRSQNGASQRPRRARPGHRRGDRAPPGPGVPVRGGATVGGLRLHAGAGPPVAVHGLPVGQRDDARRAVVLLGAVGHAGVEPGLPLHGGRRHGRVARRRRRRRPRGAAARGVQGPSPTCQPVQR